VGTGKRRWLASERVAFRLLEERGYTILETHKPIEIEGVEVGEADAIALGPDGERYVVEVKAGRLDVHGVRQAYVNALVAGGKPLVVAKGFSDDAAKALAEKLGVKVIELEDVFLVDSEELEDLVYGAAAEAVAEVIWLLAKPPRLTPRQLEEVEAIASSPTLLDAARRLNRKPGELRETVALLRRLSPLARRGGWHGVRTMASIVLASLRLRAALDSFTASVEEARNLLGP
jgi:predicted RecB family endonuclease